MFLNLFNKEEKENFLELVYKVASIDNNYDEDEQEIVNNYKIELGLSEVPNKSNIKEIIKYFSKKSEQIQKIVWFELYGVIMADELVAKEEIVVFELIENEFTITKEEIVKIQNVAKSLKKVYEDIYDTIF